jgi:hypothetical protein
MVGIAQEILTVAKEVIGEGDANIEYDRKMRDVRQLLKQFEKQLFRHEAKQGGRPTDRGFVGDLEHVESQLNELMRFLG